MNLHLYRYGSAAGLPGISIGVARYVPRGVPREERASRGYFQVWMPLLAPSRALVAAYRKEEISYSVFSRRYCREMKASEPSQAIRLIAAMSQNARVNLGCFCADENRCHRLQLRKLIEQATEELSPGREILPRFSSPACSMPEIEG